MRDEQELIKLRRKYHHEIVSAIINKKAKRIEWFGRDVITYRVVYWALRNVCALTNHEMSDFKISDYSIQVNTEQKID